MCLIKPNPFSLSLVQNSTEADLDMQIVTVSASISIIICGSLISVEIEHCVWSNLLLE